MPLIGIIVSLAIMFGLVAHFVTGSGSDSTDAMNAPARVAAERARDVAGQADAAGAERARQMQSLE